MHYWLMWFVETIVSVFMISGYIGVHNSIALRVLGTDDATKTAGLRVRSFVALFGLLIIIFCQVAAQLNVFTPVFFNLALYIFFTMLDDEQTGIIEYIVRAAVLVLFWVLNIQVAGPARIVSLALLAVAIIVFWYWRNQLTALHHLTVVMAAIIGIGFWLGQSSTTDIDVITNTVMLMLMILVTIYYWNAENHHENERHQLIEEINRDGLTGAGSMYAFHDDTIIWVPKAHKDGLSFGVIMFDIDFFKRINDHYGHSAGNSVLIGLAHLINSMLEATKFRCALYRTGGEEFNILVVNPTSGELTQLAKDILREIRMAQFTYEGQKIQVTLSMGVTMLRTEDEDFSSLYKRIDSYLYQSKHNGRNQITVEGKTVAV
ncbi:GGDEF domain-containing protein [Lacticaseibacillus zhaodongensis]|uniref:GGDEF domain-containing protein n=1 Tax=Lacticaseibacillus zhaodongensis TaxID=2668065 RepID=UPI0012D30EF3|nr:GGDEF domain-containing protein [Lacticaseibacillus zhaodongensis]